MRLFPRLAAPPLFSLFQRLLLLVLMLAALPALAQMAAQPSSPIGAALVALYGSLSLAVVLAAGAFTAWLMGRAKTSKGLALLQQMWIVAQTVVAHVEAKVRPTIQADLADGKLTPDEVKELQQEAMQAFEEALGPALLAQAKVYFGSGNLDTLLSGLLERALAHFKVTSALQVPATPPLAAVP